jgi:SnoaL-like domain
VPLPEPLTQPLTQLLVREAIRLALSRYTMAVDSGDFNALETVFHADASLSIQGGALIIGIAAILERLRGGSKTGAAFRGGRFQRHHITSSLIELIDADTARGEHYVLVITELGIDHSGRYVDRYVRQGDNWLIQARAASMEWARPDSRFVRWLGRPASGSHPTDTGAG